MSKKAQGKPISVLTCYDFPTAYFEEQAGVDMILVGDSLGMTVLGFENTLPVTMDDMIRHSQAVRRGAPNTWLVVDMPYMSYQPSVETAVRSAGRFMAETGCDAVKLEGGAEMADRISALTSVGIPVVGHLGLTPQSSSLLGGFRLQGKTSEAGKRIVEDAHVLEEAGAFAIVIEVVPQEVCRLVREMVKGAIILSQGSGPHADGQLLIFHDMFGPFPEDSSHGWRKSTPTLDRSFRTACDASWKKWQSRLSAERELVLDGGGGVPTAGRFQGRSVR